MRDQLARLDAKPAADRTSRDTARISSMKMMIQSMTTNVGEPSASRIEQLLQYRLRIPSISATPEGAVVEAGDGYVDFTADIAKRGEHEIEVKLSRETKTFRRQN